MLSPWVKLCLHRSLGMSKCQHKVNWDNLLWLDLHVSFVDKKIMQISYHTYESCAQNFLLLTVTTGPQEGDRGSWCDVQWRPTLICDKKTGMMGEFTNKYKGIICLLKCQWHVNFFIFFSRFPWNLVHKRRDLKFFPFIWHMTFFLTFMHETWEGSPAPLHSTSPHLPTLTWDRVFYCLSFQSQNKQTANGELGIVSILFCLLSKQICIMLPLEGSWGK